MTQCVLSANSMETTANMNLMGTTEALPTVNKDPKLQELNALTSTLSDTDISPTMPDPVEPDATKKSRGSGGRL